MIPSAGDGSRVEIVRGLFLSRNDEFQGRTGPSSFGVPLFVPFGHSLGRVVKEGLLGDVLAFPALIG
jgi:hypothetical protein